MDTVRKFTARTDQLISKGRCVLTTHTPNAPAVIGFPTLDRGAFTEWRTQSLSMLTNLLGSEHVYVASFRQELEKRAYKSCAEAEIGILNAVGEDLEGGYLTNVRTLVSVVVLVFWTSGRPKHQAALRLISSRTWTGVQSTIRPERSSVTLVRRRPRYFRFGSKHSLAHPNARAQPSISSRSSAIGVGGNT